MPGAATIRTVTGNAGQLYCSAGGGNAADSKRRSGISETFDKVNRTLQPTENQYADTSRLTPIILIALSAFAPADNLMANVKPTSGRRIDPCGSPPPQPGCC